MGPDSDLDVLVVMPDGVHRRDTATVVYRSLRRFPYPKDIVVATEGDLILYGDAIGLVYRRALKEGKVLYHAAWAGLRRPGVQSPAPRLSVILTVRSSGVNGLQM